MWNSIMGFLGGVKDIALEPIKGWQTRKTMKAQAQIDIDKSDAQVRLKRADAAIELAKNGQQAETNWDLQVLKNMQGSWKDEYLVVVLFWPVIELFISPFLTPWFPTFQADVIASVKALDQFPAWYTWLLTGIVIATFGLRWYFNQRKAK